MKKKHLTSFSIVLLITALTSCSSPTSSNPDETGAVQPTACEPSAPPAAAKLDAFYEKYCAVSGIHIVSSGVVPDAALVTTAEIVAAMIAPLEPSEVAGLTGIDLRVGVIGVGQVTTDMPEYSDLDTAFPESDWDERTRGLGATSARPLTSSAEENLLCYADDPYKGESILIHEFGHTIMDYAVTAADPGFTQRVQNSFDAARADGKWDNTYAASNIQEYWAEGVQSYFEVNLSADPPDTIHNHVDTRAELEEYDPGLFSLVDEVFEGRTIEDPCP